MSLNVQFYHLLTTPLERAFPALMEKAWRSGQRVVVQCATAQQQQLLDDALWTFQPGTFLPHGLADTPHAAEQPVCLTLADDNPNAASIVAVLNGVTIAPASGYDRVLDMFDGHDADAVQAARARWKTYQQHGASVSYIQQQKDGSWKKMADA